MNNYYEKYMKYKKKYTEYKKLFGGGNEKICVIGDIEGYFDYFISFILFSEAFDLNYKNNDEIKQLNLSDDEKQFIEKIKTDKDKIDRDKFEKIINKFINFTSIDWFILKPTYKFVFMGDVCDRNIGSIRIVNILLHLKKHKDNVDRVFWLIGNRDINKLRLLFDINDEYINGEDEIQIVSKYWNKESLKVVIEKKNTYLSGKNYINKYNYFESLMSNTYSAGQDIGHREKELQILYKNEITNESIYISYILSLLNVIDVDCLQNAMKKRSICYDEILTCVTKIKSMLEKYFPDIEKIDDIDKIIKKYIVIFLKNNYTINFMYEYLINGSLVLKKNNSIFLHGGLISQSPHVADKNSVSYLRCYDKSNNLEIIPENINKSQITNPYDISIDYKLTEYTDENYKNENTFEYNIFPMPNMIGKIDNINDRCKSLIQNYVDRILNNSNKNEIKFYYSQIIELSLMTYPTPITARHLDNDLYPMTLHSLASHSNDKIKMKFNSLLNELKHAEINNIFIGHTPHGITPTIIPEPSSDGYNLVTIMVDMSIDNCFPKGSSMFDTIIDTHEEPAYTVTNISIRGILNNKWDKNKKSGTMDDTFYYNKIITMDYLHDKIGKYEYSKIYDVKDIINVLFKTCCDITKNEDNKNLIYSDLENTNKKYIIKCEIKNNTDISYLLLKCNGFGYVYAIANGNQLIPEIKQ